MDTEVAKIGKLWTSFQNLPVIFRLAGSCQLWQLNIPEDTHVSAFIHSSFYFYFIHDCIGAPKLIVVTPVNSTTVTVSWSEVQCFNGSGAVTHYIVQYQSMCSGAVKNVTTNGLVQTVSGLEPNIAVYTF